MRATARPGRKRANLKKGLRDFWEKRKKSMPVRKESKKHRPAGDLFLADIPNPLSEGEKRSIIKRYLKLVRNYAFTEDDAFRSAIGGEVFDRVAGEHTSV